MSLKSQYLITLSALLTFAGCASTASQPHLKFEKEAVLEPTTLQGVRVGGLSALSHIEGHKYYALSDDRGKFGNPRVYEIEISSDFQEIQVTGVIVLKKQGQPLQKHSIDPEGLVQLPWGGFLISSEGDVERKIAPQLLEFDQQGNFLRHHELPSDLSLDQIRNNLALEALALSPDGKSLFVGMESALIKDGPEASSTQGSRNRILEYDVRENSLSFKKYWFYQTEPVKTPAGRAFVNGVTEIMVRDNAPTLWVLERGVYITTGRVFNNVIRIFQARPSDSTSSSELEKTKLFDGDDIKNQLSGSIDNQESLAILEQDGRTYLLTVSDDNFNKKQRTVFLKLLINSK